MDSAGRLWRSTIILTLSLYLAFQPVTTAAMAATNCEDLVENLSLPARAAQSVVHFARTFHDGKWKWSSDDVEKIRSSVPTDPIGRQQWLDQFRARAAKGDYSTEELLAYMQVVSPSAGKDLYKLLTGKEGVWIRRKNFWTPFERSHVNQIMLKIIRLGAVYRVKLPRKITDLDQTLVNLVIALSQIVVPKTGPGKVASSVLDTQQWKQIPGWTKEKAEGVANRFLYQQVFVSYPGDPVVWQDLSDKIFDQLIKAAYPDDALAQQKAAILFAPTRRALFQDEAARRVFLLRIAQDVNDPSTLKDIQAHLTPEETKAYEASGLPGLLDQLVREKGTVASTVQFGRIMADTVAFRALGFIMGAVALGLSGYHYFNSQTSGSAGTGSSVNNSDPAVQTAYSDPDLENEAEEAYKSGTFTPYMPGLLDMNPATGTRPCDPNLFIAKQIATKTKTEGHDAMMQDEAFTNSLKGDIQRYGSDPATGCYNWFVTLYYNQLAANLENK